MTYLVQKTNMFKQKMKIDDNITRYKMLAVQLWCILHSDSAYSHRPLKSRDVLPPAARQ